MYIQSHRLPYRNAKEKRTYLKWCTIEEKLFKFAIKWNTKKAKQRSSAAFQGKIDLSEALLIC